MGVDLQKKEIMSNWPFFLYDTLSLVKKSYTTDLIHQDYHEPFVLLLYNIEAPGW